MHSSDEAWNEVRKAVRLLEKMNLPYVLAGSLASSTRGAPRTTNDADLLVTPFPGREPEFVSGFGPEYYLSIPAIVEANRLRKSFNVINTLNSFKLDFFIQKTRPYDELVLSRREARFVPEGATEPTNVLSAEDLILSKLEWYRLGGEVSDRQWKDVIEVIEANWQQLDRDYLKRWSELLQVADLLPIALEQGGTHST